MYDPAGLLNVSLYQLSYYLETIDDEVSVIWPEPWRLGKILFLTTRYSVIGRIIFELFGASFSGPRTLYWLSTCDRDIPIRAAHIPEGICAVPIDTAPR